MVRNFPRGFPGVIFEVPLHTGGRLTARLIVTVVQRFVNGCSRRTRTGGGEVEDRRSSVWHGAWPSLGVDRASGIPTPSNVEFMAGANAGSLVERSL